MNLTPELLDALQRRYTPAENQVCVVCGAPLQFSTSGSGRPWDRSRYNCSSNAASPVRSTAPLRERLDHYEASAWFDADKADMHVVELVKAYRELLSSKADLR
jgi:hypothetical protein